MLEFKKILFETICNKTRTKNEAFWNEKHAIWYKVQFHNFSRDFQSGNNKSSIELLFLTFQFCFSIFKLVATYTVFCLLPILCYRKLRILSRWKNFNLEIIQMRCKITVIISKFKLKSSCRMREEHILFFLTNKTI